MNNEYKEPPIYELQTLAIQLSMDDDCETSKAYDTVLVNYQRVYEDTYGHGNWYFMLTRLMLDFTVYYYKLLTKDFFCQTIYENLNTIPILSKSNKAIYPPSNPSQTQ